jgi:hypothetical protein
MAVDSSESQLLREPSDTVWQKSAAKSHLLMASLLMRQGQPQRALVEIERTHALLAGLLARDAGIWAWRVELQESLAQVECDVHVALGNDAEAMRVANASVQRLRLDVGDPAQRAKNRPWLALALARTAALADAAGERDVAKAAWREAAILLEQSGRDDADAMRWLMRAHLALGRVDEASRIRERLLQAGYRHPDLVAGGAHAATLSLRFPHRRGESP